MLWNDRVPALRIGDEITQAASVAKAEFKKNMVFVHQQRDLYPSDASKRLGEANWAIREIRTHVFLPDEDPGQARTVKG